MSDTPVWCPSCHQLIFNRRNCFRHFTKFPDCYTFINSASCNLCSETYSNRHELLDHFDDAHQNPTSSASQFLFYDPQDHDELSNTPSNSPHADHGSTSTTEFPSFLDLHDTNSSDSSSSDSDSSDSFLSELYDASSSSSSLSEETLPEIGSYDEVESISHILFDFHLPPDQNLIQTLVMQSEDSSTSSSDESSGSSLSYDTTTIEPYKEEQKSTDKSFPDHKDDDSSVFINPAEEALFVLIKSNNLSPKFYKEIMEWACEHSESGFNFAGRHYSTVKGHLLTRYDEVSGGQSIHSSLTIENFPPTHIYRNDFLKHARRIYSDPDLMNGALMQFDNYSGVLSELNTAQWWNDCEVFTAGKLIQAVLLSLTIIS